MTAELLHQIADTGLPLIVFRLDDCPIQDIELGKLNVGDYRCSICASDCVLTDEHLELLALGKNPVICMACITDAARNQA